MTTVVVDTSTNVGWEDGLRVRCTWNRRYSGKPTSITANRYGFATNREVNSIVLYEHFCCYATFRHRFLPQFVVAPPKQTGYASNMWITSSIESGWLGLHLFLSDFFSLFFLPSLLFFTYHSFSTCAVVVCISIFVVIVGCHCYYY